MINKRRKSKLRQWLLIILLILFLLMIIISLYKIYSWNKDNNNISKIVEDINKNVEII